MGLPFLSEGSSQSVIPGLLKRKEARPLIFEGIDLARSPLPYDIFNSYNQYASNPYAGYQMSGAEQDLINQLFSQRQSQFNNLGIGDSPLAQSSIAASAAPALINFRQNYAQTQGNALSDFARLLLSDKAQRLGGIYQGADYGKIQGALTQGPQQGLINQSFGLFNDTIGSLTGAASNLGAASKTGGAGGILV